MYGSVTALFVSELNCSGATDSDIYHLLLLFLNRIVRVLLIVICAIDLYMHVEYLEDAWAPWARDWQAE